MCVCSFVINKFSYISCSLPWCQRQGCLKHLSYISIVCYFAIVIYTVFLVILYLLFSYIYHLNIHMWRCESKGREREEKRTKNRKVRACVWVQCTYCVLPDTLRSWQWHLCSPRLMMSSLFATVLFINLFICVNCILGSAMRCPCIRTSFSPHLNHLFIIIIIIL